MDATVIERAQQGDRRAFNALVEANYDFVHAVAWRWSGNGSDAEDIAQDVCVKLASAIRGFRGTSRFRTWLYTLTLNAARDHQRKRAREWRTAGSFATDPAFATNEAANDNADQTEELWVAVRALPDKQCDAVLLVYGEGLSHAAAADVMGCSEPTVSWHVHEARKRLKILLGRETV